MLLSSIGLIVLPHATHIPLPLFSFFVLLWVWRFLAIRYHRLHPDNRVIFAFTLIAVLLLLYQHQGIWGRNAGTSLFITALGLKLLEIKRQRDLYLTTYLAFFVAATQFLYLQNILMGAYILLVSCLLLCTLVFINSQKPNIVSSLKIAGTIIFQAIPLMIVVFIFFPRIEAPRWSLYEDNNLAFSGLSDYMEPGSLSRLAMSDQLAFRVTFDGEIPPLPQRYWRGPVLTHTDGKRWTAPQFAAYRKSPAKPVFYGTAYGYKLLIEPQKHNWVYALDMPARFGAPLTQNPGYNLVSNKKPDERAEYEVVSYPDFNTGALDRRQWRTNLQLPGEPTQRITRLVTELGGFNRQPEAFVDNVLKYFSENNFYYTLNPPLYPVNPVETFLLKARAGFCSHYASAFVYLMRVARIPARIVTGYQGGELNEEGNFLEIRQYNAHAWAEAWLAGNGWERFDPTAAVAPDRVERDINIERQQATGEVSFTVFEQQKQIDWLQKARAVWGNIDYSWQRWIINYHGSKQTEFLSFFGIDNMKSWIIWLSALLGGIIAILSLLLLRKPQKPLDKALRIYNQFCRKLSKNGLDKKPAEGAKDFALRAKTRFPEQAEKIDRITTVYIRIRYGRHADHQDLLLLKKLVASL